MINNTALNFAEIKSSAEQTGARMRQIILENGLSGVKKNAPLGIPLVLRALVMLRCLYRARELGQPAPTQNTLCSKKGNYVGLIADAYAELKLTEIIPDNTCSGAPHVQSAAHLLSDSGCLIPRGALKSDQSRAAYELTEAGLCLAFYLFGDNAYVTQGKLYGWTGIPPLAKKEGKTYCPWLDDFLAL